MKIIIFCLSIFACCCSGVTPADEACTWVKVDKAVDGDTLRLQDGRWVRCAGIDTPEIDHKNGVADPLGYEARDFLRKRVNGKRICLKIGIPDTDGYGRLIAYLFDEKAEMINAAIVAQGLGHVYPHAGQNQAYSRQLLTAQRHAMKQRLGIWRHRLNVKGALIGNRRSKRFHLPACPFAGRISRKNRKKFTTVWDAYWAGYAPGARCLGSPVKKELKDR